MMTQWIFLALPLFLPGAATAFAPNPAGRSLFLQKHKGGRTNHHKGPLFMVDSIEEIKERTYIMIKPDGVQRGLVGTMISRFENKGYKLVAMKMIIPTEKIIKEHYKDLVKKPFFPKILTSMTSGPVICMVWEGRDSILTARKMLGTTDPLESQPGTIRGDFAVEVGRNLIHGSDSVESADREIKLWFDKKELVEWTSHSLDWIYRIDG